MDCNEKSLKEVATVLWQRTNRIENFLGIEYNHDHDGVHGSDPVGILKKMRFLCERWEKICKELIGE